MTEFGSRYRVSSDLKNRLRKKQVYDFKQKNPLHRSIDQFSSLKQSRAIILDNFQEKKVHLADQFAVRDFL